VERRAHACALRQPFPLFLFTAHARALRPPLPLYPLEFPLPPLLCSSPSCLRSCTHWASGRACTRLRSAFVTISSNPCKACASGWVLRKGVACSSGNLSKVSTRLLCWVLLPCLSVHVTGTQTPIQTHAYTSTYTHAYIHKHKQTSRHTCTYMYTCIHVYTHQRWNVYGARVQ